MKYEVQKSLRLLPFKYIVVVNQKDKEFSICIYGILIIKTNKVHYFSTLFR